MRSGTHIRVRRVGGRHVHAGDGGVARGEGALVVVEIEGWFVFDGRGGSSVWLVGWWEVLVVEWHVDACGWEAAICGCVVVAVTRSCARQTSI